MIKQINTSYCLVNNWSVKSVPMKTVHWKLCDAVMTFGGYSFNVHKHRILLHELFNIVCQVVLPDPIPLFRKLKGINVFLAIHLSGLIAQPHCPIFCWRAWQNVTLKQAFYFHNHSCLYLSQSNSLAPGRFESHFRQTIFKLKLETPGWGNFHTE